MSNDKPAIVGGADVRLIGIVEVVAEADTVGARLRIARHWAGLTMGQAARLRGCTVPEVSDAERDQWRGAGDIARWVMWGADYYGVSARWLYTGVLRVHEDPPEGIPDAALLMLGAQ